MSEGLPKTGTETRKLAAIMFTDIVGFSRQMGADEAHMLRVLAVHNQIIHQAVADHHGHVIKTMGDAFLVDFPSVVNAVQCAQYVQAHFRAYNGEKDKNEQIHIRIGIHLGDIIQQNGDVLGDGVNVASRLQAIAEPDTICISQAVYKEIEKKLPLDTVISLGRPKLKNIAQREPVYALLPEPPKGLRQTLQVQRVKLKHRKRTWHVAVAVLLLVIASSGAILLRDRYFSSSPGLPLPDKPSLVVLPFMNMSGDPGQEYFSDGITEVLTSDLSQLSNLFVISRNSAFFYKGKTVKLRDVSKELGVQYVLEGSVQRAGDQVRVAVQLINATTDYHLWSEHYDRPLKDLFVLQDEIVQKIVTTLKLQLTLWEQGLPERKTTDNLEAYNYYLRGVEYIYHYAKETNAQARQMFERAIELDPQYAEAYANLGLTYFIEWAWQWRQDAQALEQALTLGHRAVALEDSLPRAHHTLAVVYLWKKQHEQAMAEAERAIALSPNDADLHRVLAEVLALTGRPEEAIGEIEKAIRLNPHSPAIYLYILGRDYHWTGRYEEALATLKKSLTRDPDFQFTHLQLAAIYSELGREDEARAEAAEVLRINPNFSLEFLRQNAPLKDPAVLERDIASLRKAGLK
jgi:adenylate cyclase